MVAWLAVTASDMAYEDSSAGIGRFKGVFARRKWIGGGEVRRGEEAQAGRKPIGAPPGGNWSQSSHPGGRVTDSQGLEVDGTRSG